LSFYEKVLGNQPFQKKGDITGMCFRQLLQSFICYPAFENGGRQTYAAGFIQSGKSSAKSPFHLFGKFQLIKDLKGVSEKRPANSQQASSIKAQYC